MAVGAGDYICRLGGCTSDAVAGVAVVVGAYGCKGHGGVVAYGSNGEGVVW
jgi:hypothetical protein